MKNSFTINEVRSFWDEVASIYEKANKKLGYVHTQRFEKAIEFGQLKPHQKILNIWSRTGNLIPYLRKTPKLTLTNLEVSSRLIDIAKKKYPKENFEQTNLESLAQFKDRYFDRVISLETLEHTPNPPKFLRELNRVLKPGGLLLMSLPPRGFEIPTKVYDLFFSNHGEGPHQFLSPPEVKPLLKKSGFKLIGHKPFIMLPLGNDKLTRMGEQILTAIFAKTPIANLGVRHFYICQK